MILVLLACTNESSFNTTERTDTWTQNPSEEADILMVVDNSNSMAPYQAKLAVNFDRFMEYFIRENVRYRVGLTTTDNTDDTAGSLVGPPITPETIDAAAVFADMVNVGTGGSGFEMGLETAWKGLSNPDFLRPEASLSILVVSDEDDSSPDTVDEYAQRYFDAKAGRSHSEVNFSALVVLDETVCTPEQAHQSTPSARYPQVALQTRGVIGNLCETGEAFASILTEFSLTASRLQDKFFLSRHPNARTLEVTVQAAGGDPVIIPCDTGEWTYVLLPDEEGIPAPAVQFRLDALPPSESTISVRYNIGTGDIGDECY